MSTSHEEIGIYIKNQITASDSAFFNDNGIRVRYDKLNWLGEAHKIKLISFCGSGHHQLHAWACFLQDWRPTKERMTGVSLPPMRPRGWRRKELRQAVATVASAARSFSHCKLKILKHLIQKTSDILLIVHHYVDMVQSICIHNFPYTHIYSTLYQRCTWSI